MRFYPVIFFLSALSFLFFIRALKSPGYINLITYTISTWLLMVTHYFGALLLITQVIIWLYFNYKNILKNVKYHLPFLAAFLVIAAAFLPFLMGLLKTLNNPSAGLSLNYGDYFFINYFDNYFGNTVLSVLPAAIGLMVFMVLVFADKLQVVSKQLKGHEGFILLSWVTIPIVIAFFRSRLGTPSIADRYAIIVLPSLILLVAKGFLEIRNTAIKTGLVFLFTAGSFTNLFLTNEFYTKGNKDDFKGIVQTIKLKQKNKNFHVYSDKNWHFRYYYNQQGIEPGFIDNSPLTDSRFYTGKLYAAKEVLKDTSVTDFWLATAHFYNMEAMRNVSQILNESKLYLKIDSFTGSHAFAEHYIRKDWNERYKIYSYVNITDIGLDNFMPGFHRLSNENGVRSLLILNGDIASYPIKLSKGSFQLSFNARGTVARDTFPELEVMVNDKKIGGITCGSEFLNYNFEFDTPDSVITIKLKMINDFYDSKTDEDRNVYVNSIGFKRK